MGEVVVVVVLVLAATASAQPAPATPPVPATPPAPVSPPVSAATTSAPAAPPADDWTVDRHGIMLLGGFEFASGGHTEFGVLYVPIPLPVAPRLKLGITGSVNYQQTFNGDGNDLTLWAYYAQPRIQYDWRLPIISPYGDFAFAAEAGPGFGQVWVKLPSGAFMPPGWEHVSFYSAGGDVALQFQGHSGLVVSVQPVGFSIPLSHPSAPDSRWAVSTDAVYIFSLGAGYRWR